MISSLATLNDGRLASGSYDQKIFIWDTINGKSVLILLGHTNWVGSLAVLNNTNLVSCSGDQIKIWNIINNGTLIKSTF